MFEAFTHHLQRLGRATRPLGWNSECDAELEGDRAELQARLEKLEDGLRTISAQATASLEIMQALEVQSKRIADSLGVQNLAGGGGDGNGKS